MIKKVLSLSLSLLLLIATIAKAQNGAYSKANKLVNIGIGVNSYYSSGIPIGASFEKGITDDISVGASIDYLSSKYNYGFGSSNKFTSVYIGVRGSYHLNKVLKLNSENVDLYAGATLGYRKFSFKNTYTGASLSSSYDNGLFLGAYAGGKYYFHPSICAFAEVGASGSTNARLGVGFKF